MLIGLAVGTIVSPPLIAHNNGVFDKITCREIEVIDKDGNEAIWLYTTKHGGGIRMGSKDGRNAIMVLGKDGGNVQLSGKGKEFKRVMDTDMYVRDGAGVEMSTGEHGGRINVFDKQGVAWSLP